RYRQISTFGSGTIRCFSANSSEMKKLAARDFEDLLQARNFTICLLLISCAIPAFEGLLEGNDNKRLMKLLYRTAEWHGLAKLRMHTESSLSLLDELTKEFGELMRKFQDLTCAKFSTVELPKERAARRRRQIKRGVPKPVADSDMTDVTPASGTVSECKLLPANLNLSTVKFHFLGDYVQHIRNFGTTDSYSTQLVCPLNYAHYGKTHTYWCRVN
ncbi:hypothetical protein HYPSUDRAFT_150921, partial [Hypholoma sublateritium FD-334 SS-4]